MPLPRRPVFDTGQVPVKLRCASGHVYGLVYPDGTVEVRCREKRCRVLGREVFHLFDPKTGLCVTKLVLKGKENDDH